MICYRHVRKAFNGRQVLTDVNFVAPRGEITGLVGPNGAGKSTALRVLLGLESADSGVAEIDGRPYREFNKSAKRGVGVSLDTMEPHPSRRAKDQLAWIAAASGVSRAECDAKLRVVGLDDRAAKMRAKEYSLGMKQRLRIATALLGDPAVLVLDEPVNGLDPEGIRWLRQFLVDYCSDGGTVLLTSHLMNELELIASRFVFLTNGRTVKELTPDAVRADYGGLERAYFEITTVIGD